MLFIRSLRILLKERPSIIFCQSPPISCAFIAIVYGYLYNKKYRPKVLIDLHGIEGTWSKRISRCIMKCAHTTIVTNMELQNFLIANYNVKPIILEDPIPHLTLEQAPTNKKSNVKTSGTEFKLAVISSFAKDEPLQEILLAASELSDIQFFITGNSRHVDNVEIRKKPPNVTFTGFLNYDDYIYLIQQMDAIMDLTTNDKTLVAGAYEAVALGQPLITSNWTPLRRYFNKGTVHVNNTHDDIKKAIRLTLERKEVLRKEMQEFRVKRMEEYERKISNLRNFLGI